MNILWLTWKDGGHPTKGGAEVVLMELSKRLVRDGHGVTLLTCGYPDAPREEEQQGITILRVGTNRYMHSFQALAYYLRHLRNKFDIVIEVVNTAPYFGVFFGKHSTRYLFYHQLAREIWFYEAKPPLSQIGYHILEPLATRLLGSSHASTITISESTKKDLMRYGFSPKQIHVIAQGISQTPITELTQVQKYHHPTLLSFGALRAMKRTEHQIAAFTFAKQYIPDLHLIVAGKPDGTYGKQVLDTIAKNPYAKDIEYLGVVGNEKRRAIMGQSHIILQTSLKEGWGLTISEAAGQGTPAVAYDVDGLRDSIRDRKTGILTDTNPEALAHGIVELLSDTTLYQRVRKAAWRWSHELTFDNAYKDLKGVLGLL